MPVIGRRAIPALRLHLPNKLKKFIAEFLFRNEILFSFSFHNFHFFNCETFFKPNPTGIRPAFVRTVPRRIQLLQQNREKNDCMQNTNYQTESSIQNSPLERGWGCVTSAHSLPNQKHPPEANKPHLKKQQQKHPNRAPHRNTPLTPQSNNSLSNRKQHPKLPSREGPGVCHAQALPPKTKTNTRNQQTAPQKTAAKTSQPRPSP